jgi:hypothetical protein
MISEEGFAYQRHNAVRDVLAVVNFEILRGESDNVVSLLISTSRDKGCRLSFS